MKIKKLLILSLPSLLLALAGCASNPDVPSSSSGLEPSSSVAGSVSSSEDSSSEDSSSEEPFLEDCYSVEEAIALSNTNKEYNVMGTLKYISNYYHGQCVIGDDKGNELEVFGLRGEDGETYFDELENIPYAGDTVIIQGVVKQYNGKPEMGQSKVRRVYSTHTLPNQEGYEACSISSSRSAEVGKKVKLTGVVAKRTQTQKLSYNGFYLIDGTGSIFVYGGESAVHVQPGNTVTIIGEVDHFIAEEEASYAATYGYQGAIQIKNSFVVENKKGQAEFDRSWIQKSTMREILNTPLSNNITSSCFLVTGFVKRVQGEGFVNYYLNDLDGHTGGRVYTSNSGSDFAYLDDYQDKVVSMVVSPINCKSTISGTEYRFIPLDVKVIEGYSFDLSLAPQFALDNMAMDQFESLYNYDPAMKVATSYSNSALGIEGVTLSYSSSDESVLSFVEENGVLVFHVNATVSSSATITVKASLNGVEASATKEISYEVPNFDTITIAEAIEAPVDTEVTVRGVVAGRCLNKIGVFLVDDTGMIAVQLSSQDDLSKLTTGDEVIVSGKRIVNGVKNGFTGQINLGYSKIEAIVGSGKSYSREHIQESTIDQLASIPLTENVTTNLYHVSCFAKDVVTNRGFRLLFLYADEAASGNENSKYLRVYSNSDTQWQAYEPMLGKQVSVDLALVNWNGNGYQAGIFTISDGKTTIVTPVA